MEMPLEIYKTFEELKLKDNKYLLAFSGGPDSVYLLYLLSLYYKENLKDHIILCYINYHDSEYVDKEEKIVDNCISKFNLVSIKDNVNYDKEKDKNFEEWARDYRYNLFKEIVLEKKLEGVLTAHQKTDIVETYLLQKQRRNLPSHYGLRRENILNGLKIIRPILSISKEELTNILDKENIEYYFDITNTNLKKERNRIRYELKEEDLNSYIEQIKKENENLRNLNKTFSSNQNGMDYLKYNSLTIDEQKRYCFFLLDTLNIKDHREGIGKRMFDFLKNQTSGTLKLNKDLNLYRTNKKFFIHGDFDKIKYSYSFDKEGIYENDFFKIDLNNLSLFNLKTFPVTIRNYMVGDKISTNLPTKDIKKSLQKQSVPFYLINVYPVFIQDNKIICLPFYKDILNKKIPLELKFKD